MNILKLIEQYCPYIARDVHDNNNLLNNRALLNIFHIMHRGMKLDSKDTFMYSVNAIHGIIDQLYKLWHSATIFPAGSPIEAAKLWSLLCEFVNKAMEFPEIASSTPKSIGVMAVMDHVEQKPDTS